MRRESGQSPIWLAATVEAGTGAKSTAGGSYAVGAEAAGAPERPSADRSSSGIASRSSGGSTAVREASTSASTPAPFSTNCTNALSTSYANGCAALSCPVPGFYFVVQCLEEAEKMATRSHLPLHQCTSCTLPREESALN